MITQREETENLFNELFPLLSFLFFRHKNCKRDENEMVEKLLSKQWQ